MVMPACGGHKEKSSFRHEKALKIGVKVNSILDTRYSTRIGHPKSRIEKWYLHL